MTREKDAFRLLEKLGHSVENEIAALIETYIEVHMRRRIPNGKEIFSRKGRLGRKGTFGRKMNIASRKRKKNDIKFRTAQ